MNTYESKQKQLFKPQAEVYAMLSDLTHLEKYAAALPAEHKDKIKDLNFENQLIKLEKTKNKRQQIISMANTLKVIQQEYLDIRGGEEDYLFCTETGEQIKIRSIEDNVKLYNNRKIN